MYNALLAVLVLAVAGCETNRERAVTGEFFNRKAGNLQHTSAVFDSTMSFGGTFSTPSTILAGKYGTASAFSVFKFTKAVPSVISGLQKVQITLQVAGMWSTGDRVFGLYSTSTDWNDTTRLAPDHFLTGIGDPLATWSDTSSTISSMTFVLDQTGLDIVKKWDSGGAFLIKETGGGASMADIYSTFSSYSPTLSYISLISGNTDTTNVKSTDSAYFFDTGYNASALPAKSGVLSDGNNEGFVVHFSLPESFPRTNTANGAKLVIPIVRNDILPTDTMNIEAIMLTGRFTTIGTASTSSEHLSDHLLTVTDSKIEVDISGMINTWILTPGSNYGILFKSTKTSTTPSQIVVAVPDSVELIYTAIPEEK
jgi:hypothetical protein